MIHLQGYWFDGKTSRKIPVFVEISSAADVCVHYAEDRTLLLQVHIDHVEISSRVGNTPRYFYFPDGQKFETQDHQQADQIISIYKPSVFRTLAHKLESHIGFVLMTLVVVVSMGWASVKYGLPAASKSIALALPPSIMNQAATETLTMLDKFYFGPSQLAPDVQARVLKHFNAAIEENKHLGIKVLFRDGKEIGANAFALPNGTVVFTDQIVELAENDNELLAVLAHEIGHVEYRHSLRGVIQASALSFSISMLVGDVSAMGDLLINLPILLTTSAYSRNFEREADDHSLKFLDQHKIPRHSFIDLMDRLSNDHKCNYLITQSTLDADKDDKSEETTEDKKISDKKQASDEKQNKNDQDISNQEKGDSSSTKPVDKVFSAEEKLAIKQERKALCEKLYAEELAKPDGEKNLSKIMDYFSSHPATEERLEKFRKQPVE